MGVLDWLADVLGVSAPSALEFVFMACAFFGTIFFILMMGLMLIGDIFGGMVDSAFDADLHMDSSLAMELFSIQGIAAAIMMFGMTGMFVVESTGIEVLAVIIGIGLYKIAKQFVTIFCSIIGELLRAFIFDH